jgi:hypothetical protein
MFGLFCFVWFIHMSMCGLAITIWITPLDWRAYPRDIWLYNILLYIIRSRVLLLVLINDQCIRIWIYTFDPSPPSCGLFVKIIGRFVTYDRGHMPELSTEFLLNSTIHSTWMSWYLIPREICDIVVWAPIHLEFCVLRVRSTCWVASLCFVRAKDRSWRLHLGVEGWNSFFRFKVLFFELGNSSSESRLDQTWSVAGELLKQRRAVRASCCSSKNRVVTRSN